MDNKWLQDCSVYTQKGQRLAVRRGIALPPQYIVWESLTTTQEHFEEIMQAPFPDVQDRLLRLKDNAIPFKERVRSEIMATINYRGLGQAEIEELRQQEAEKSLDSIILEIHSRIQYKVLTDILWEFYNLGK